MPLTQDRMLTLISAANAYRDACEDMTTMLVKIVKDPSIASAMLTTHTGKMDALDKRYFRALANEDAHFAAHGKRNAREAIRLRAKRAIQREAADHRGAAIAHNKRHGPTTADIEAEVTAFLADQEAYKHAEAQARAQAISQPAPAPISAPDEAAILRRDGIEPMPIPGAGKNPFK